MRSKQKGFSLLIIILLVFVILGISFGSVYFFKLRQSPTINPTPIASNTEKSSISSPTPTSSPYLSNEIPNKEIDVVAGGLNLIDFTPIISTMTNPTISIKQGKQEWMLLQTETPTKKTNIYSFDTYFHSVLAFAPPKNTTGKYDVKVNILDNNQLKDSLLIRVNVLSNPKSRYIGLPPKNIKAVLIGVGFDQSIQNKVSVLESAYYEASGHQGSMQIAYLGNVPNNEDEVWKQTDKIIDSFIEAKGKSTSSYDLGLVYFKSSSYGGAPRTNTSLKKIAFCCENTILLHEFIHLARGIGDIGYENTLLPPDPLHYPDIERSNFYSDPILLELGFNPKKKGLWILVDEWGYKKIGNSESYKVIVRNTGSNKDTIKLDVNSFNSLLKVSKAPSSLINLNDEQLTLDPGEEKSVTLLIKNPSSVNEDLFGLTITGKSQTDESVWDKANIYFETSKSP